MAFFFNTDLYGIEDALYRSVCSRRGFCRQEASRKKRRKRIQRLSRMEKKKESQKMRFLFKFHYIDKPSKSLYN